jgi:hypothetical protein
VRRPASPDGDDFRELIEGYGHDRGARRMPASPQRGEKQLSAS